MSVSQNKPPRFDKRVSRYINTTDSMNASLLNGGHCFNSRGSVFRSKMEIAVNICFIKLLLKMIHPENDVVAGKCCLSWGGVRWHYWAFWATAQIIFGDPVWVNLNTCFNPRVYCVCVSVSISIALYLYLTLARKTLLYQNKQTVGPGEPDWQEV